MISWIPASVANHLWQSTIVVALVWLVTLALRRHDARVRYWLWAAASLKFLLPFSWLIGLGALVEWRTAPTSVQPAARFVMEEIMAPPLFSDAAVSQVPQDANIGQWTALGVWLAGTTVVLFWWVRQWRPLRSALRSATPLRLGSNCDAGGLTMMSSPSAFEPGVVGILRPVLLVPEGLIDRLTPAQLDAILAHERAHVRAHDNFFAMLHMAVEAIFWFHPLVWWIERRMIDERERACDEAVVRAGKRPADYAEGILAVCRWSQESPVMCVAGVTGSDLRTRIETILANRLGRRLHVTGRGLLACAALIVIGGPIGIGLLVAAEQERVIERFDAAGIVAGPQTRAAEGTAPALEVASIKTNRTRTDSRGVTTQPGRLTIIGLTAREIVAFAYGIPNPLRHSRIAAGPKWLDSDRFDIVAKAAEGASLDRLRLMLRALLADRFRLVARSTTAELPIYALRLAQSDGALGPRLRRTTDIDCVRFMADRGGVPPPLPRDPKDVPTCVIRAEPGLIVARSRTMQDLTTVAFPRVVEDRVVVDRTGLTGSYDVLLEWTPEPRPFATAADLPRGLPVPQPPTAGGPSIFTAIQEQLGLRLQSDRGPVDVLMIERVERPSED